jgi:AraC-like DNA-binding protein
MDGSQLGCRQLPWPSLLFQEEPVSGNSGHVERARFLRPLTLSGVEALPATFLTQRYVPHVHDSLTVAHVDRGAATFELQGSRYVAPAGSTFLIPPHSVHTGESASAGGYSYRVLYLDPLEMTTSNGANVLPAVASRMPIVIRRLELAEALHRMHGTLVLDGRSLERGEALMEVARRLEGLFGAANVLMSRPAHPLVQEARDYIHAHWQDDFSLAELAGAVGLSPFYLVRLFRAQVGMPPSSYRRALRVQAAQRLLRTGEAPAEVAARCGFYDQAHLNRHFKRVTGATPGKYAAAS